MHGFSLVLTSVLLAAPQTAKHTLVVAPIKHAKTDANDAETLAELIRIQVGQSQRYTLITPEELGAVDEELKRQLSGGCDEESCIAELGTNLGAKYILTGRISRLGRRMVLTLKLMDIEQLKAINTASIQARDMETIADLLEVKIEELLGAPRVARASDKALGPTIQGSEIRRALGWINVTGSPPGTQVTIQGSGLKRSFTLRAGRPWMNQVTPGTYRWRAQRKGYEDESGTLRVRPDQTTALNLRLKPPGNLLIEGSPKGAKVEVWGPNKLHAVKGLPLRISRAPRGVYKVRISSAGYRTRQARVKVEPAATARLSVRLREDPKAVAAAQAGPRSRAKQINEEVSFLYGDFVWYRGVGEPEQAATNQSGGTIWLQLEGIPGAQLPAIHLGVSVKLEELNHRILRIGYEHYLSSGNKVLPMGLFANALVSGDLGLEVGTNIYLGSVKDDKKKRNMLGSTIKLSAIAGASQNRGMYVGLGAGISWAGALILLLAAASGG